MFLFSITASYSGKHFVFALLYVYVHVAVYIAVHNWHMSSFLAYGVDFIVWSMVDFCPRLKTNSLYFGLCIEMSVVLGR